MCYLDRVRGSILITRFNARRRECLLLVLIIFAVALLSRTTRLSRPEISVSGLTLQDTRSSVQARLRTQDYRMVPLNDQKELWYKQSLADLTVVYHGNQVHSLQGGVPEIDGQEATFLSIHDVETRLGPPEGSGSSGEVGQTGQRFLSYPDLDLLVQGSENSVAFVLFRSAHR